MIRRPPSHSPAFPTLLLALAVALVIAGCGKKGPPLPPIRIVPAATGPLTLHQVGRDILLAADLPGVRSDGTPIAGGSVRVLRLESSEGLRPGVVSDRYLVQQFERQAHEVVALDERTLPEHIEHGRLHFVDRNPAESATGTRRFLYGLQVVDAKGARSPQRPPSYLEWVVPPEPPPELKGEVAEGEVRLTWTPAVPPAAPASGGPAPAAKKFAVYRREATAAREPESPVHPGLLEEPSYVDRTFRYDVDYLYTVRSVASDAPGAAESASSEPLAIRPHDSFAPATPSGIAVSAEGDAIKVYWFPNTEPDLAGYRVYRREEGKEPARVAEVPASETSWVDAEAAPGVRYHYSVSAFDATTPVNESPRSEERSERRAPAPGRRP